MKSILKGSEAEDQARRYLNALGIAFVSRNYRCRCGEIDLIMRDDDTLVFVEVRYRKSAAFGSALESITQAKIRKLRLAAKTYLLEHRLNENQACRFDVMAIDGGDIDWIKNAF